MAAVASPSVGRTDDEIRAAALEAQQYTLSRIAAASATNSFRSIPIIDLKRSFSSSLADRQAVASQIHEACTKVGFFYITGHGMEEVCDKTLKLAERFFSELPQASKDAIHLKQSTYHRGYEPASYSSLNDFAIPETKEAFNWGYEKGIYPEGDDSYVELDGSKPDPDANLWPKESELPGFYKGIAEYYGKVG
jgi:isopenicillin N synthase-like dioxygenase